MISSIFSFIVRTIILEPMALIGIAIAIVGWYGYDPSLFILYAQRPITYGIIFAIALLYALMFKHVYQPNSKKINWWATIKSSISHFMTIIIATVLTIAVISAINYSLGENLDKYLRNQK